MEISIIFLLYRKGVTSLCLRLGGVSWRKVLTFSLWFPPFSFVARFFLHSQFIQQFNFIRWHHTFPSCFLLLMLFCLHFISKLSDGILVHHCIFLVIRFGCKSHMRCLFRIEESLLDLSFLLEVFIWSSLNRQGKYFAPLSTLHNAKKPMRFGPDCGNNGCKERGYSSSFEPSFRSFLFCFSFLILIFEVWFWFLIFFFVSL